MQQPDNNQRVPEETLEAPPDLVSALKCLPQEPVFIPPTADEAVLRAAQKHLAKPAASRLGWLRLMPWVAATAGILLLAAIPQLFKQRAHRPAHVAAFARADLNHDGQVDILDALALARQLKQGRAAGLQWDVNGDGVVDERDVATLAARAVRLEPGRHS
jgi:Dockerin type I domain